MSDAVGAHRASDVLSLMLPMRSSSDDDESWTMCVGLSRSHAMRLRCTMRISGAKHWAFGGHGFVTDSMLIAVARKLLLAPSIVSVIGVMRPPMRRMPAMLP